MKRVFRRYLTSAEERQLFGHISSMSGIYARRDHAWMRLLRQTGIRVGTLAGLNVFDARQGMSTKYLDLRPEITKRRQGGRVFLTKKGRTALGDLLKIRKEMGYGEAADDPLIYSRKHQRMSIRNYEARMRYWCESASLEVSASPHWLRHSLAKRIMHTSTSDDPRGVVQAVLGHRSIASTVIYTVPDKEEVELAMEEAG
ncbi:MAG: tyrosine-type recombinase/integrase [Gammaproteobacteria bacterium]|nr:tyrosine-type recombinase/integrase [Gammaproteobacteria bacterium]